MILVTGATGKIGSELVKLLVAKGEKVRALSRDPGKKSGLEGPGVQIVKGDLGDPASLGPAFEGADKVFILTHSDPQSSAWQHNAIEAAKRAGARHVVKLSVIGADKQSPVALARWHAQTEDELKTSGLAWTILQPTSFMQNTLAHVGTVQSQGAFYGANGKGKTAMIDARDIAEVAAAVLTGKGHEGKSYPLVGEEALDNDEVAAAIGSAIGKPVKYVDVGGENLGKALLSAGLPQWLAADYVAMAAWAAGGGSAATSAAVRELTGKPARRYAAFAKDHAAAFKGA